MIILSSFGLDAPMIQKKYREHIHTCDRTILMIPFAALNDSTVLYEKKALMHFGFDEQKIMICSCNNIDKIKNIEFDYIYVPGGDTYKLLFEIKKYDILNYLQRLINKGATYIGVSAGAYICCEDIKYLEALEDNNYINDDFSALGLLRENIVCHSDQYGYETIAKCKIYAPERRFVYITNTDVVLINNE